MLIIGIDPGIAITGYAVLTGNANQMKVIDYGAILTSSKQSKLERLGILYEEISRLISIYRPQEMGIEQLFFNRNVTTALTVGEARGVVLLAAQQHALQMAEYTPLEVKQAVAGYGKATKAQIQQMVKVLLGLPTIPKPDDVADALAIAICHIQSRAVRNLSLRK